jgi:hypothetical protein
VALLFCQQNRSLLLKLRDVVNEVLLRLSGHRFKYYWIRVRVHTKKYNGKVYRYEYVEIYDRVGTKYTNPKPIARIRTDDPRLEEKLLQYRLNNALHDLYLTLRRINFNIDRLLQCYSNRKVIE